MITVNVPINNLGKAEKALGRKVLRAALKDAVKEAALTSVIILRRRTVEKNIRHKYRMAQGWQAKGLRWDSATLYNKARHAIYVEQGRRPHQKRPPLKAIETWLRYKTKKVVSAKTEGGITVVKRGGRSKLRGKEIKHQAFLVARAIGRKGIKARPVMTEEKTQKAISRVFIVRVNRALSFAFAKAYRGARRG